MSSKNEEITLPHNFFYVHLVFQWGDIAGKVLPKWEVGKNNKRGGGGHIRGLSLEGGFKPAHYACLLIP